MLTRLLAATCFTACLAGVGLAQSPLQDLGFSPETPFPDPDLVVVRERTYDEGGIDLTAYGIGTGLETYVQSIYFRLHTGPDVGEAAANGLVVFPEDVRILGFVTSSFALGGSLDDGVSAETDGIFGIAANPDDYSALDRGLEDHDYVCLLSPNTLLFLMEVDDGLDDFRVIVDYGDSFLQDVTFDLFMSGPGAFRGVAPSPGLRVGDDLLPAVPGSGDYGEIMDLAAIPLTTLEPPHPPLGPPTDPEDSVYVVRNTPVASGVDAYDFEAGTLQPAAFLFDYPGAPVGITAGADGFLYSLGVGGSIVFMDVESGSRTTYECPNLEGANVDLTDLAGTRDLFLLRNTVGDTVVDRLDLHTMTVVESFPIPLTTVSEPVGITDGNDGMIYVLGRFGSLTRLDTDDGALTSFMLGQPVGTYEALTRDPENLNLYLLRRTDLGAAVDRHLSDCGVVDFGIATFPSMNQPADITYGPEGLLYLVDEEFTSSPVAVIHPLTGAVEYLIECVNFIGFARGIAFTEGSFGETYCTPAVPNSTGEPAWISAHGSRIAGEVLTLAAWGLPPQKFGYFLTSMHVGEYAFPGGSRGILCLDLPIGRFNQQVMFTGDLGRMRLGVDTNAMPLNPLQAVLAGERWNFQVWFRDADPNPTSNFSNAISVEFE